MLKYQPPQMALLNKIMVGRPLPLGAGRCTQIAPQNKRHAPKKGKTMESIGLKHAALDRMMVREFCNLSHIPYPLICCVGSDAKMKEYEEGQKKADKEFIRIMANPKEIEKVTGCYLAYLNASDGAKGSGAISI